MPRELAFHARFSLDLDGLRDADGRPLVESYARDTATMQFRECPYPGSRQGYLLNRSALEQMSGEWSGFLGGIDVFRNFLCEAEITDGPLGLRETWRVATGLTFLPCYLHARFVNADSPIPNVLAALFKANLDIVTTADLLMVRQASDADVTATTTAVEFAEFAEQQRLLVNERWVCAGSPKQIQATVAAVMCGAEGDRNDPAPMRAILDECDEDLRPFIANMQVAYLVGLLYQLTLMRAMEPLFSMLPGHAEHAAPVPDGGALPVYETRRRLMWSYVAADERFQRVCAHVADLAARVHPSGRSILEPLVTPPPAVSWPDLPPSLRSHITTAGHAQLPRSVVEHIPALGAGLLTWLGFEQQVVNALVGLTSQVHALGRYPRQVPFDVHKPFRRGPVHQLAALLGVSLQHDPDIWLAAGAHRWNVSKEPAGPCVVEVA